MTDKPPLIAHVPIPLGRQGSTLMAVSQRLIECHGAAGGASTAILSDNRSVRLDGAENVYVDYTRYCPREWFSKRQQGRDVMTGRMGFRRRYAAGLYIPAIEAVKASAAEVTILYEGHYAAPSLPLWSRLDPAGRRILYVHNPLSRTYGKHELRRLLGRTDAVVFCAEHLRLDALRRMGGSEVPLRTIHNGLEKLFFTSTPRLFPERPSPFKIIFAGQVGPHKGPHLLIEAVAATRALTDVPVELTIVGSGAYDAEAALTPYERGLRVLGRERRVAVDFVPFVDKSRLLDLYRSASLFCAPSARTEGFGLVALEAMAAGTPVLCFDVPGLSEACGDAAAFARSGDAGDLAAKIAALAGDPTRLEDLSRRGRQRAREFSWERTYAALVALLAEM